MHRIQKPNHANSRWICRGLSVALSLIGLVCLLEGCLVPQSIDSKETALHPPPRIKLDSIPIELLPPILPLFRQGSTDLARTPPCHCWLELRVPQVEIDDPTATLLMKWFVDYDTAVPTSTRPVMQETLDATFNSNNPVRVSRSIFTFDANQLGILTSGVHVVDVVVGQLDGFDQTATARPAQQLAGGRAAPGRHRPAGAAGGGLRAAAADLRRGPGDASAGHRRGHAGVGRRDRLHRPAAAHPRPGHHGDGAPRRYNGQLQ